MKRVSLETLKFVSSGDAGLNETEVIEQRRRFGANVIVDSGRRQWIDVARDTIRDPMVWFLGVTSVVFFFVGQRTEALTLVLAILPLTIMDAFLHWRTRSAMGSLKGNLEARVRVLRDSREQEIDSKDLVPGDIVILEGGRSVPVDGIIEECSDLQIDEAILTGESYPVTKQSCGFDPTKVEKSEAMVEPTALVLAGTRVLTGRGRIRALSTGIKTTYGEIVRSVAEMPQERTPLQLAIGRLVRGLLYGAGAVCLLLAIVRIIQGHGWVDAILSASTLAVAAIPEEFPVVFTFFLGVGVYRLARRRALVRRAVSVENIGRVTHICTDKTGTITQGLLTLAHLDAANARGEHGLMEAAVYASNPTGTDPLDVAVFRKATELGVSVVEKSIVRRFPFTEDRKKESVLLEDGIVLSKGAPETILSMSILSAGELEDWRKRIFALADGGHKVLACAKAAATGDGSNLKDEPTRGFEFLGLLAFEDPARPEVASAIAYARTRGIKVIMITGDHPATSAAIARDIGLGGATPVVASAEETPEKFEERNLEADPGFLARLDVVARCTPMQKLRIVSALKKSGALVAVTGDGVNDVPALKAADIGIAMGLRGTQSAKEVSSIILSDDNFSTIIGAIREGRQLFTNLKSAFEYLFLIHIPFVLSAAIAPLLGYPILYLPIHIVWLELVIHPSAILAFQSRAVETDSKFDSSFFARKEVILILATGAVFTAIVVGVFSIASGAHGTDVARTMSVSLLTLWSSLIVGVMTKFRERASIVVSALTLSCSVALVQTSGYFGLGLHVVPLNSSQWGAIIGLNLAVALALLAFKRSLESE